MGEKSEKTLGTVLILFGISMWELLPQRGFSFTAILLIHMGLVIPGVYFFEKPFIRYLWHKIRGQKGHR